MKLWKGKEKEGVNKGIYTLFVGDYYITFTDIKKAIKDDPGLDQIYFGAGGCTRINNDVIYECFKKYKKMKITAEISIDDLTEDNIRWLKKVNVIITFINDKINLLEKLKNTQIKLHGKNPNIIYVETLSEFVHNNGKKDDVVIK